MCLFLHFKNKIPLQIKSPSVDFHICGSAIVDLFEGLWPREENSG